MQKNNGADVAHLVIALGGVSELVQALEVESALYKRVPVCLVQFARHFDQPVESGQSKYRVGRSDSTNFIGIK